MKQYALLIIPICLNTASFSMQLGTCTVPGQTTPLIDRNLNVCGAINQEAPALKQQCFKKLIKQVLNNKMTIQEIQATLPTDLMEQFNQELEKERKTQELYKKISRNTQKNP